MRKFFKDLRTMWRSSVLRAHEHIMQHSEDVSVIRYAEILQAREVVARDTEDRPPAPDDLAIRFAQALLTRGGFETDDAAVATAWAIIPTFYIWRERYANGEISTWALKPATVEMPEPFEVPQQVDLRDIDIEAIRRQQREAYAERQQFPTV